MAKGPLDFLKRGVESNPEQATESIARLAAQLNQAVNAGDKEQGAAVASEICSIIKKTWPDAPQASFAPYFEIAGVLHATIDDLGKAEWALQEALQIRRAVHGKDHPAVVPALGHLGDVTTKAGRLDEAASLLLEARDILERAGAQPDGELVYHLTQLALAMRRRNDRDRGTQMLEAAVRVARAANDGSVLVSAQLNLATFYEESGRYTEAIPLVEATLAFIRGSIDQMVAAGGKSRESLEAEFGIAEFLSRLAKDHLAVGASRAAIPLFEEALAVRTGELGENHPDVGRTLALLAEAHEAAGDEQRAASLYQKATAILQSNPG